MSDYLNRDAAGIPQTPWERIGQSARETASERPVLVMDEPRAVCSLEDG